MDQEYQQLLKFSRPLSNINYFTTFLFYFFKRKCFCLFIFKSPYFYFFYFPKKTRAIIFYRIQFQNICSIYFFHKMYFKKIQKTNSTFNFKIKTNFRLFFYFKSNTQNSFSLHQMVFNSY